MNTMSILSALSDSGMFAVGNRISYMAPETMTLIGEDDNAHVAAFEAEMDSCWCDCCRYNDDNSFDWYQSDLNDSMWDDIEAAQRQADRDEEMKASWLRGEWHTVYAPHWFRDAA